MEQMRYEDSGINKNILRAVKEMGFEQMTPIQAQAIPVLLEGKDIIGQAQTGTGKTAAFGIPVLQRIDESNKNVQAIILCPTRELAIQAAEEMRNFAKFMHGVKVLPIYGGQDITKQIRSLKGEVQVVVGTPGRVMDHMRRHTLKLNDVNCIVLDEADEMLNMGFREDIETILSDMPQAHQTALFSATMPKAIMDITNTYQTDAILVKVAQKELTVPLIKQYYYEVKSKNKEEVVCRLLDYYNPKLSLIFCNTKKMVDDLADSLKGRGYFAEGLHGDLSQYQRDNVMRSFRDGKTEILIATDVAARGIDVDDVEAVFNYDIPQDIEYYVHRIGRTGRAGRKGRAFTLVVGREIYKIRDIERTCSTKVKAKTVPSAADVTAIKAEKVLNDTLDILKDSNLENMIRLIEEKLNDEDCTALELAAAFLKMNMGVELVDIPVEEYTPDKRASKRGSYGERRGNDRGGNDRGGRSYGDRSYGDRSKDKKSKDKPYGEKSYSDKPKTKDKDKDKTYGDRPKTYGDKSKAYGDKPKTYGDKPKAYGDKPKKDKVGKDKYPKDKPKTKED